MRKWLALLLAVLAALPLAAHAERSILVETRQDSTPNGKPAYALVINGVVVAKLAKPTVIGGVERTPQRGIAMAAAVLTEAYRGGKAELSVTSDTDNRDYTVAVNGKPLIVASDMEGKAWGATPGELAQTWQHNILNALDTAGGDIAPTEQVEIPTRTPETEQKPRNVVRLEPGEPSEETTDSAPDIAQDSALLLEDEQPSTLKAGYDQQQHKTTSPVKTEAAKPKQAAPKPQQTAPKTAQPKPAAPQTKPAGPQTGGTAPPSTPPANIISGLDVRSGSRGYEPPARQSIDPMDAPPQYTALVTGANPSAGMIKTAVDAAIRAAAGLPDTTTITWRATDEEFTLPALTPGTRVSIPAVYKINADTNLTPATLTLENRSIPAARETVTFFSNVPENIKQEQLLYYATLPPGQAARLVFHHQNQSRERLRFVARVVNTEGKPLALHITPGISSPNLNTFFVGFKSAESFWQNLTSGSGYVLRVPAGGQAWIVGQDLDPGYTASGYYRLSNVSDSPLRIETLALHPDTPMPKGAWPSREGASCGVYPQPYITTQHDYIANSSAPWLYLRLGEDAPASETDDSVHYGCYGVTHTYEVNVTNAKDIPALVFVVLRGSAGEVKGQFYIDDEFVSTPLVRGGEEQLLKEIPLPPKATKKVRIKAIALNGSFYPASIIFREERITIRYDK
jgi:hypothetical protein